MVCAAFSITVNVISLCLVMCDCVHFHMYYMFIIFVLNPIVIFSWSVTFCPVDF